MTTYTCSQLAQLWIQAGGSPKVANLMASIAMAESSGNSGALNLTDNNGTQTSVGLWQVSTGTHSYPQSWTTAAGNAAEAVAKYASQGLSAWGTYDSGAYKQYCGGGGGQTGNTTGSGASGSSGGGSGGGGGGGGLSAGALRSGYTSDINPLAPAVETTSFLGDIFSTILDPFKEMVSAESDLASFFSSPFVTFLDVFKTLVTGINALVGAVKTILYDVLWLFNPSHWIRMFCFLFGLFTLVPATYALMHTGTGDMYLAMGIFLFTLTGILLFLAFHNLPYEGPLHPPSACNVITFQALLAYVSESIRTGGKLDCSGVTLDAYTLGGDTGGGGGTGGISLAGMFSPDSTGGVTSTGSGTQAGSAAGSANAAAILKQISDATGIFPILTPGGGIIPAGSGILPGTQAPGPSPVPRSG